MSVTAKLQTSMGEITLSLDSAKAPKSVENFVKYAQKGHYNGTVFHRVIDGFMIQGGGMNAELEPKPTDKPLENEADNGLKNVIGSVAMARTNEPHSAACQFFINVADNTFLNHKAKSPDGWGYAVFGQVSNGLEVVQKIAKVATGNKGHYSDVPVNPIVIESVEIEEMTQ